MTATTFRLGALAAAFAATTALAAAAPAVGLSGDRTLVMIDTADSSVTGTLDVSGVDRLIGIDVRPADGMLYGVAADGVLVTIDVATGAATAGPKIATMLPDGVEGMVDFNPAADRLRVMGVDGTNLRIHPDTGATTVDGSLNFEAGDRMAEDAPDVVATAYTSSRGKPESTAMYDVGANGNFYQQVKPNDGTLKTIGSLGVESDTYAFDIEAGADGSNTAWLVAAGALHKVDLSTGAAAKVADIAGLDQPLRDIAILPSM